MSTPTLDVEAFVSRLEKLYSSWEVSLWQGLSKCALIRMRVSIIFSRRKRLASGAMLTHWLSSLGRMMLLIQSPQHYTYATIQIHVLLTSFDDLNYNPPLLPLFVHVIAIVRFCMFMVSEYK